MWGKRPIEAEERARLIAAGALCVLALMAMVLIMTQPRHVELGPRALRAEQLGVFATDVAACRAALSEAGFATSAVPDLQEHRGCGYRDAVELTQSTFPYSAPVLTSCRVAAALALWERDVVAPAAAAHLGQTVSRIELAGPAYTCRAIAGRRDGRMSEHATANAIDIDGFTLADGRRLSVAAGWRGDASDRAFLRAVRDGACGRFRVVLSPDYNRAHRDHLHFDMGDYALCR